jgi:cephalosporin-C deacetylase-like acetyl esterase
LIDRGDRFAGHPDVRSVKHSQRETLWRASYQMGRHPLGYEIQKVLAAADWMEATRPQVAAPASDNSDEPRERRLGLIGYGEGGLIALYAGALDTRFHAVTVCGAFGLTRRHADLPVYRNVWSLLERFGDAEVAAMIAPRTLVIEHGKYPNANHTDQHGGAPGLLWRPDTEGVAREISRIQEMFEGVPSIILATSPDAVCDPATALRFYEKLTSNNQTALLRGPLPRPRGAPVDAAARTRRQYLQILDDTQHLMHESPYQRASFWKPVDRSSLQKFADTVVPLKEHFQNEVIGMIPPASLPPQPRTRFLYQTNGYTGYEVVLDVHPDVFAHGILLVPDNIPAGVRRPVVVCQHGLEGRPSDVANPELDHYAYHQYACRLAENGYITFSPQNPYIGGTRFRQVLRKAQPLGLTLWSYMVRQHEVITDWLVTLPNVDSTRIAFYGLSYGGKSAMRLPILVDRYCLSICSADYNEWIWKNVSSRSPYSYLWTSEYDMPEWNLGNTFNYAELSWLIFPRPFMVERGHDDGVAPDEWVAYEFAKTRRHYVKMGMEHLTTIEYFDGPHTIHGKGTFQFLNHHLYKDW